MKRSNATDAGIEGRRKNTAERMKPTRAAVSRSREETEETIPADGMPGTAFYGPSDWWSFALATLLVLAGYGWTLAPDVTLEDSGEMAVAAQHAGVPHAPGYPVWTLYSWLCTKLLPMGNVAWRVTVGSAVAGAVACGLVALMVSRGSRLFLKGGGYAQAWTGMHGRIAPVAGIAAGMLLGFSGFVWSQAVIVEVYTLSLLSLTAMMATLFRWIHRPAERRYLYLAWFLFGLCLNNHQSLVVAALAIEVCVAMADPRLGRDLFLGNTVCYVAGWMAINRGWILSGNGPLVTCYHAIGLGSVVALIALTLRTRGLGRQMGAALACGAAFLGGAIFYLWLPITSMSNPPMNWAYPRTVAGFFHALTRGQYESPHPATSLIQYGDQLWHLALSAIDEFGAGLLLVGLVPLLMMRRMAGRDRSLVVGGLVFYLVLGPGLLFLLNPGTDRATLNLVRVFFGASHVMVAMAIGFGAALGGGLLLELHCDRGWVVKRWVSVAVWSWLTLAAVSAVVVWGQTQLAPARWASLTTVALVAGVAIVFWRPRWTHAPAALLLMAGLLPLPSMMAHGWSNGQRGHLFGYWYGHDMFSPPFRGPDGHLIYTREERAKALSGPERGLVYPEMARNAVLFGGTDPGRFCPTYMIFSDSFLPAAQRRDPEFDRRDAYIITQNALADAHYLEYIRAHYQRSAQQDPYFFSELLRGAAERSNDASTNCLAKLALPLDRALTELGAGVERERRAAGVYPAKELRLPTNANLERAMRDFMLDFQGRAQRGQLRPGEAVQVEGGRVQVTGTVAVMGINAILTRQIFEQNPGHEFYVEESFPLDWMYPHLTPFGTILKLERQPAVELGAEVVERDRRFWSDYLERLMGDWVKPETNIAEICAYVDQVHGRQDLSVYRGDLKFIRDEPAQKAFSKLRSSIGGVYDWRFRNATGQLQVVTKRLAESGLDAAAAESLRGEQRRLAAEQGRMYAAAELAFKQAYAMSPISPEAMQRLVQLLLAVGRIDEALRIAETSLNLDPRNAFYLSVAEQLRRMRESRA